jgi:hypothetical protein
MSDDDGVWVGQDQDGDTWTVPSWDPSDAREWQDVHTNDGSRAVMDQDGNVVIWDADDNEVATVQHNEDGSYSSSTTELE